MSLQSISSVGLSGINAATLQQFAASSNIANSSNNTTRRLLVEQSTMPDGSVSAKLRSASEGTTQNSSGLVTDIITQITALYSFKANVITIRTADELIGATLNIRA
ncbi:MAG: hypothetical protein WCO60_13830 [Verrucomicrobiota bacterium]